MSGITTEDWASGVALHKLREQRIAAEKKTLEILMKVGESLGGARFTVAAAKANDDLAMGATRNGLHGSEVANWSSAFADVQEAWDKAKPKEAP